MRTLKASIMKYYIANFTIKDKKYLNPYIREKKAIYFKAEKKQVVEDFIIANHIDSGGAYKYTIKMCKESDLNGVYYTDGFQSCVRVGEDNVIGKMDISNREFLARVEVREHNGEYAKVLNSFNIIAKGRDHRDVGNAVTEYINSKRLAYYEDYVYYTTTDNVDRIEEVKKNEKFFAI